MSGVQLLDDLLAITHALQADQERELTKLGLTTSRTHLLWILHHNGPLTQARLAEALDVTPRNVTALVDALESTGFARRSPHPTDRRALVVSLTEHGTTVMTTMATAHVHLAGSLVEGLDHSTVNATERGLAHLRARLEKLVTEARPR
ncbi:MULTISPECIES: MarR family winged helix-turn-helix transcriptional regulator [unclassified Microbacterium]|uniref:MarR family winged helix-turn-helix transcriptional regulator n=1 Tax=unclassified Microbacterium TaxID=2609290 RepID=UPI000C2CC74F|nr:MULTISPECIES: MarR family transcriptional regulator [unclassified Microbacterium]